MTELVTISARVRKQDKEDFDAAEINISRWVRDKMREATTGNDDLISEKEQDLKDHIRRNDLHERGITEIQQYHLADKYGVSQRRVIELMEVVGAEEVAR